MLRPNPSNPSLSTGNATDSICPYGWQLANSSGGKSFSNLTNAHLSFSTEHNSAAYLSSNPRSDITLLSFFRSGSYDYSNGGALYGHKTSGYYWSRSAFSTTNSYYLAFYPTNIVPQNNYRRGDGYSLRCLAR